MKTIAIAMAKGGVGKTTIAAALSVRAAKDFKRVAMLDLNRDQANLTQWWHLRNDPENPQLFTDHNDLVEDLPVLEAEGWDVCILDTPPSYLDLIETSVMMADAVLLPIKSSIFDAGSLEPVVEMCRKRRKPFAFVLSDLDQRFKTLNAEVAASLKEDGPVLSARVSHLQSYIVAPNTGKTGAEIDKRAAGEIDALWSEAMKLAGICKARRRKGVRVHG